MTGRVTEMKGPNPFTLWEESLENLVGRKEEEDTFRDFLNRVTSRHAATLLITGVPGAGKSILLRHFSDEAQKAGLLTAYAKVERGEQMRDIIAKLRHEALAFVPLPAHPISGRREEPETLDGIVRHIMHGKKNVTGIVFFIDDIDEVRDIKGALRELTEAMKSAGILGHGGHGLGTGTGLVVSSTRELAGAQAEMRNLRLKPFDEHDARELVTRALKGSQLRMGDECLASILADTGGNPRLFRIICWQIYEKLKENDKVISKGHYMAHLPTIMNVLSREWFGRMFHETPKAELGILAAMSKEESGMHVSDIAREIGRPLGQTTALMGRLLARGGVVRLERGKYAIFATLYARYVAQRI